MTQKMTNQDIKILELFNEKTKKLGNLSFIEKLSESGFTLDWDDKKMECVLKGPDDEAIDAFINTLRFFIQNNEPCSIKNLDKIYSRLGIHNSLKNEFKHARLSLNSFLNSESLLTDGETNLKNSELLDVFIYGDIAHSNKKHIFDVWKKDDLNFITVKNEFVKVLNSIFHKIIYIKNINLEAINILKKKLKTSK